jgi:hypothetical protein
MLMKLTHAFHDTGSLGESVSGGNRKMAKRNPDKRAYWTSTFRIGVENRDYHHLSQSEIDGGKRISRQYRPWAKI